MSEFRRCRGGAKACRGPKCDMCSSNGGANKRLCPFCKCYTQGCPKGMFLTHVAACATAVLEKMDIKENEPASCECLVEIMRIQNDLTRLNINECGLVGRNACPLGSLSYPGDPRKECCYRH